MSGIKFSASAIHPLGDKFSVRLSVAGSYLIGDKKHIQDSSYKFEKDVLEHAFRSDYYQLTIPVHFIWDLGRIKPYGGVYFNYKRAIDENTKYGAAPSEEPYFLSMNYFGVTFGLDFRLTNRIGLQLSYL